MPSITIHTRDPLTGRLANVPDLAVALRVDGVATGSVSVANPATGEYVATFAMPAVTDAQVVELIASSATQEDASVVWRNRSVDLSDASREAVVSGVVAASATLTQMITAIREDIERPGGMLDLVDQPVIDQDAAHAIAQTLLSTRLGEVHPLVEEVLDLLQSDPPTQTGQQQHRARKVVRGDAYGPDARPFIVTRNRSASWPLDLSEWAWALHAKPGADNQSTGGTPAGTVAVSVATGESRALDVTITSDTATLALGRHEYAVRGTREGRSWTVELGVIDVVESPAA